MKLSPNLGYMLPNQRSYFGVEFDVKLISVKNFKKKESFTPTEKILLANELAGVEPIEYLIQLDNKNKELGRITRQQLTEILNDVGFNVYPKLSGAHGTDFSAVMNVKGFVLPGWQKLPDIFSPKLEKLLLTKFAPGKERLHIRVFENNDGKWLITAHTDYNWINLNLYKVYKSHMTHGAGNYRTGTLLMTTLLNKFQKCIETDKTIEVTDIIKAVKLVYKNN